MEIKLLIADDHQLFRESLAKMFTGSIQVIAEASDGEEALALIENTSPDVVLMDIGMNGMNGIDATRLINTRFPEVKVIGLSMHAEKNYIKGMLEAGAKGYLLKSCTYTQLTAAINSVNRGYKYLTDDITRIVVDDIFLDNGNKNHEDLLTDRETEVLKLYAEGLSTRQIAEKLFVSVKTIGTHKQNILKKLKLNSAADLIRYGIKNGLVELD
jgi:DNA-binding NarL/FixJ family response regulator